jgi:hypothetical protein
VRGQRHALATFYPRERPDSHCTGGWVGTRAGLERCGNLVPTGIRSLDRLASIQSLYLLSYPPHCFRLYFLIYIPVLLVIYFLLPRKNVNYFFTHGGENWARCLLSQTTLYGGTCPVQGLWYSCGGFFCAKFNSPELIMLLARLSSSDGTVRPHDLAVARGWVLPPSQNHESVLGCYWLIISHRSMT